nr:MAG TPA: hypothetical protein [Caudoviricetes sp.]
MVHEWASLHGLSGDGVDAVAAVPGRGVDRGTVGPRSGGHCRPIVRGGRRGGTNPGKVGGGGGLAAQGLPVTGLEDIAQAAADALVAAVGVAEKADGHPAIHAAVNVGGGQLTVDVVDAHHLGLVLGGGGQDPMALALITKGDAGGAHAVTVMDGHLDHGGPGTVPHLGQGLLGGGVDGGVNVRLGGVVRLGDEQGDGILGLPALLGGPGGGQTAIGEAHLAGQHFHGVILIHNLCSPFCDFIGCFVSMSGDFRPDRLDFCPALMPGFGGFELAGQAAIVFEDFHHRRVAALGVVHLAPAMHIVRRGQFPGVFALLDGPGQIGDQAVNGPLILPAVEVQQLEQLADVSDRQVNEPVHVDVCMECVRLHGDEGVRVREHGAVFADFPVWDGGEVAPGLRHLVAHGPLAAGGHRVNRVTVPDIHRDKRVHPGPGVGAGVVFKHRRPPRRSQRRRGCRPPACQRPGQGWACRAA